VAARAYRVCGAILSVRLTFQNGASQKLFASVPAGSVHVSSIAVLGRYAVDAVIGSVQFLLVWHAAQSVRLRG